MSWSKSPIRKATAGGAQIAFTDLDDFPELLVSIRALMVVAGPADIRLQVSNNNGSSWIISQYVHAGNTGTDGFYLATGMPTPTSPTPVADERMSGEVELYRWNLAQETWAKIDCGRETTATGARRSPGRNTTATAFNALRLIASSGNLQFDTNGAVEVFYRT